MQAKSKKMITRLMTLGAVVVALVLASANTAVAQDDLVQKRGQIRHPVTPSLGTPSETPGRDAVIPIDPPRPHRNGPRYPREMTPTAGHAADAEDSSSPLSRLVARLFGWLHS